MHVTPTLKIQTRRRVAGTGTVAKSGTWCELKQAAPVDVIRFHSWLSHAVYIHYFEAFNSLHSCSQFVPFVTSKCT